MLPSFLRSHGPARRVASAVVALLAVACTSTGPRPLAGEPALPEGVQTPAEVERQLAAGDAALADQRPWHAAARALALRETPALAPEARAEVERLLELAISEAARTATRSGDFDQISARVLPRRSRAIFAVGRARLRLAEGDPMGAFRTISELEREHPTHHLRPDAGDVVAAAGLSLARDGGRYLLFFSDRKRASTALEYLVLEHPSHPRAPEVYAELAAIYEEANRLDLAIERHADLLLYHPASAQARGAEAQVPALRLERLVRDDFDRQEVERARDELERWLERHAGRDAEQEVHVRALLAEAQTRLVRHDLVVARFYLRVDRPFGARLHADRALEVATGAGLDELAAEAAELSAAAGDLGVDPALDGAPSAAASAPSAAASAPSAAASAVNVP